MDVFALGLAVALGLVLVKEAGLPVPVPGDLIVIALGIGALEGRFDPGLALGGAILASVVGGTMQYWLVRSVGREPLLRLLDRVGVPRVRIEALGDRLRRRGRQGVAIARMTPGVRIGAVAAAGVAAVPPISFVQGLAIGNAVFIGAHFALGAIFGVAALTFLEAAGPAILGVALLAVVGWLAWRAIGTRRPAGDWSDAACPICVAVAATRRST